MNNLEALTRHSPILQVLFIILFFNISFSCYSQKNYRDSLLRVIKTKENKPDFTINDTTYINLLTDLAWEYRYSNSDSLLTISNNVLNYSLSCGYEKGIVIAYYGISSYYLEKGKDSLVFSYLNKAEKIAKRIKDTVLLLKISNYRAIEYDHIGASTKSLKEYLQAEKLAKNIKQKEHLLHIYQNAAATYSNKKLYKRALKYFKHAEKTAIEMNDKILMATIICNMSNSYIGLKNYDTASKNLDKGIKILEKHKINEWTGYAYMLKGDILLKQNKLDEALMWYKKSEPIQVNVDYEIGLLDLYNNMSKVYLQKGDIPLAKKLAVKSCNMAKAIRYPLGISNSAENLSIIYEKQNDLINALKYHRLFKKMSDSLSKNDLVIGMAFLDIERTYENEQFELINQNNLKYRKQKQILYIALATLLGLCTIAFLVIKNLKTQKKMSATLKYKNEILAENQKSLKTINKTKDKLFSIIGHDLRGPILSLKELLNLSIDDATIFQQFIPKLKTQVEHIHFTLDNLLSWGKTQMQGATHNPSQVNIFEIAQNNVNLFSKSIDQKKINTQILIKNNYMVLADKDHVDITIRNLISNAIKFTPEKGNIIISSYVEDEKIICDVKNTGIGIQKENIHKIFNETFHYTTYGTLNEKGTGLGLTLCKEMIELNNGAIWVTSDKKNGTTFSFSLPIFIE